LKQCAKDLGGFFVMMGLVSCYKTIFARCSWL
jgi:hypothetical protein